MLSPAPLSSLIKPIFSRILNLKLARQTLTTRRRRPARSINAINLLHAPAPDPLGLQLKPRHRAVQAGGRILGCGAGGDFLAESDAVVGAGGVEVEGWGGVGEEVVAGHEEVGWEERR